MPNHIVFFVPRSYEAWVCSIKLCALFLCRAFSIIVMSCSREQDITKYIIGITSIEDCVMFSLIFFFVFLHFPVFAASKIFFNLFPFKLSVPLLSMTFTIIFIAGLTQVRKK